MQLYFIATEFFYVSLPNAYNLSRKVIFSDGKSNLTSNYCCSFAGETHDFSKMAQKIVQFCEDAFKEVTE